jgi:hypothetical protein
MGRQAAQVAEDLLVVLVVAAQLEAVALRDLERHFEDVDAVQAQPVAESEVSESICSAGVSRFSASTNSAASSRSRLARSDAGGVAAEGDTDTSGLPEKGKAKSLEL